MESRKIGIFEKVKLRLQFPKIPSKNGETITIKMKEYELMKKMIEKEECYIIQIHEQNKIIKDLKERLTEKESSRRKLAGRIGAMTRIINGLKK